MEKRNFFSVLSLIVKNSGLTLNVFLKSNNLLQRYSKTYTRRMFKDHFTTESAYRELLRAFPQLKDLPQPKLTVRELPLRVGARRVKGKYVFKKNKKRCVSTGFVDIETGPTDALPSRKEMRNLLVSHTPEDGCPSNEEIYDAAAASVPTQHRRKLKALATITDRAIAETLVKADVGQIYNSAKEVLLKVAAELGYGNAIGIITSERVKVKNAISGFDQG